MSNEPMLASNCHQTSLKQMLHAMSHMPTSTSAHVVHSHGNILASSWKFSHAYAMVFTVDAHALVTERASDETACALQLATIMHNAMHALSLQCGIAGHQDSSHCKRPRISHQARSRRCSFRRDLGGLC